MAKAFFIGGAPRAGKTTVVQHLIETRPMLAASTDAIRSVAKGVFTEEGNPKLFKTDRGAFGSEQHVKAMNTHPETVLEHELGQSEETWKSVLDFVGYNLKDGKDIAIEGVAVLPKNIAKLDFEYKSVFMVNLEDQTDIVLDYAHKNSYDWLSKYDEEVIRSFCLFNQHQNKYYYEEAVKYSLSVVTVDNENFDSSVNEAVDILIK